MSDPLVHRLQVAIAEVDQVVAEVYRLLEKYLQTPDPDFLPAIAMNLQSLYTGIERMMVAVALSCEQVVPEGKNWHRLLLEQMGREVPQIRPPLVSDSVQTQLDELRRFRHVVRSIYSFTLDPDLLLPIAERLSDWYGSFQQDLEAFITRLSRTESGKE